MDLVEQDCGESAKAGSSIVVGVAISGGREDLQAKGFIVDASGDDRPYAKGGVGVGVGSVNE